MFEIECTQCLTLVPLNSIRDIETDVGHEATCTECSEGLRLVNQELLALHEPLLVG